MYFLLFPFLFPLSLLLYLFYVPYLHMSFEVRIVVKLSQLEFCLKDLLLRSFPRPEL